MAEKIQTEKPMTVTAAAALGVGSMIGAGIFALMGEAGAIAGSAVYLSFIAAGMIALASGYSMARLGARYPSAGGIVEYLAQAYGIGLISGALSILLYISALVALALVAKTFGSYALALLPVEGSGRWVNGLADVVIIAFVLLNLEGAKGVAALEKAVVAVKVLILIGFAAAGLYVADPEALSTDRYPAATQVLYSLAVTFFAFEGFRVITNCAEEMPEPRKTLPRAMLIAIGGALVIYVAVALAVFGNLGVEQVVEAKDYALAEAARPVFGLAGFSVVAIAALVSTASSINANLYAVTNVTYQLAKEGELPAAFGQPIGRSREGLLISAGLIMLLGHAFDLSEIAAVGSITILIVHLMVHLGHLRLLEETGASPTLVLTAIVLILVAIVFASLYALQTLPHVLWLVAGSLVAAAIMEILLHRLTGRRIRTRTPEHARANGNP
ncbi:MAG: APC family permease [Thiocapsa sp.]|nr:APC family permease [Thiocapsa sp.]MCG6896781.1 APC family permease [Thiocapsa sp.]